MLVLFPIEADLYKLLCLPGPVSLKGVPGTGIAHHGGRRRPSNTYKPIAASLIPPPPPQTNVASKIIINKAAPFLPTNVAWNTDIHIHPKHQNS